MSASPAASKRIRLEYLDGLRGLAALYVVCNHTSIMTMNLTSSGKSLSKPLARLEHILHFFVFNYGTYAVAVFIVLSGYLLMLPVARRADLQLSGGVTGFVKRRARRILPPYYAAMACSLLLLFLLPILGVDRSQMSWATLVKGSFTPGSILSHLFLVHNLTRWIATIDPPMWSVSVEWQIYFVFALLLLPVYRRFGVPALIGTAFALFVIPAYAGFSLLKQSHPWFAGLFALGMAGACINFSPNEKYARLRASKLWLPAAGGFLLLTLLITLLRFKLRVHIGGDFLPETATGLAVVCFIVHCTRLRQAGSGEEFLPLRILGSRPLEMLGVFSYSLYLAHDPVVEVIFYLCKISGISPNILLFLFPVLSVLLALLISYCFHLLFEKRFLPSQLHAPEKASAPQQTSGA